jgi:hypothetical protein
MPKAFCPFEHWLEGYHSFDEVGKVYNPSVYYLEILISQIPVVKRKDFFRLFQAKVSSGFDTCRDYLRRRPHDEARAMRGCVRDIDRHIDWRRAVTRCDTYVPRVAAMVGEAGGYLVLWDTLT